MQKNSRKNSSVLTEKRVEYAELRLNGKSKRKAAIEAGYNESARPEKSQEVQKYLKAARTELSQATGMTRDKVVGMLERAYDMAEKQEEPAVMVAAARELGKMFGYYEAVEVKHTLSPEQKMLLQNFRDMSREELAQIADGKALIIDGEYRVLS